MNAKYAYSGSITGVLAYTVRRTQRPGIALNAEESQREENFSNFFYTYTYSCYVHLHAVPCIYLQCTPTCSIVTVIHYDTGKQYYYSAYFVDSGCQDCPKVTVWGSLVTAAVKPTTERCYLGVVTLYCLQISAIARFVWR